VVRDVAAAGAAGVFFGRNVFQADNISKFIAQARSALDGTPETELQAITK